MHPAAAPKFREELLQVLKLHGSRLIAQGSAEKEKPSLHSSISLYRLAVSVFPNDPEALTLLGRMLFVVGDEREARLQWLAAVAAAACEAECVEARESLDLLNARAVNRWHYRMINDVARNESYQDALFRAFTRRNARPTAVLDIGAGTGLLAMYAARCSATDPVWACEMSAPLVEIAAEVLAANNLRARIALLPKHSDDLRAPQSASVTASVTHPSRIALPPKHSDDLAPSPPPCHAAHMSLDAPPPPVTLSETETASDLSQQVDVIVTETADCGLLGHIYIYIYTYIYI
jgi:type II protein arginine methyltransferase